MLVSFLIELILLENECNSSVYFELPHGTFCFTVFEQSRYFSVMIFELLIDHFTSILAIIPEIENLDAVSSTCRN